MSMNMNRIEELLWHAKERTLTEAEYFELKLRIESKDQQIEGLFHRIAEIREVLEAYKRENDALRSENENLWGIWNDIH